MSTSGQLTRLPRAVRVVAALWTLASTADQFVLFVVLWIAGPQGWSGMETALLIVAIRLPVVVGGLIGGRAVDRYGPVPMLVLDGVVRCVVMAALVVVGWDGQLPVFVVLGLCAFAGFTSPLSYAGARTLVPRLVEGPSLAKANALLGIGDQVPLLLGAVLAGPAIALLGPGRAFLLPLVMMLAVAVVAFRLPRTEAVAVEAEARQGWASAPVVVLIGLSVAYYFTYGPFETVVPFFVREQLGSDVGGYSLLWILFGAAALATLPLAPWLARRRPGMVNAYGAIAWGLVTVPLTLTSELPVAAAVFLLSGAVWGPYSAVEATALQRWTNPATHGRVFGTQRALLGIASPLGAAVGALALERAEPAPILAISALACSAAGLLALYPIRRHSVKR